MPMTTQAKRERRKRNIALALVLGGVGGFVLSDDDRAVVTNVASH